MTRQVNKFFLLVILLNYSCSTKYLRNLSMGSYSYKDLQHTETFDACKLMQSVIFIYCFDAFLDFEIMYFIKINLIFSIKNGFTRR